MVMHARKHPRLSDGYFERNTAHPYEGSNRYSKSPFGEGSSDKSPANENALCNDSPDSRPSPRYSNKSSYSQRLKEREREHTDPNFIKSPLPKDRNNRSREHQTPSNSSSSSSSRKGFDGPLGTAAVGATTIPATTTTTASSSSGSRANHDRGSHPEEKEKRLQVGDWSEHVSSSGKKYYYNCRTEVSQWEKPREWIEWEKHQGIYKPVESNRTKGTSSSKSSEKHSNSSSGNSSSVTSGGIGANPNSVPASFRSSQSHQSSHGLSQQPSTGRQASSSHSLQSSGGSSSSSSSGGRSGRPASTEEHHGSHHHSIHHQHHNSNNNAHHSSSTSSSSHHHGRGGHEDHLQGGSGIPSEGRSVASNSVDHRHHHHSGSRRPETLKDPPSQDMDISPDTSETEHHPQQNSRPHPLHHQVSSHGQHPNEQSSHHQQRSQCRTPTSKGSNATSLAAAQLLSPSQVTLANLPKLISQMAGTKGLPNLKELSPEEALQTIQQALQLTKQLGGLNRSPHGASLMVSDHQHKVSATSPVVNQAQLQTNSNSNNCSLSYGGLPQGLPFVPSHSDGKDAGNSSPISDCNSHSSRQASPTSSVSSLPSLPVAGSSSLASLKPVTPSLTPSLANYFREDLIGHVTGWQADHAERQASRYSEEAHTIGSLNCTRVSAELKMARSLVRLAEIQATLQEQRILFLRQQVKELEDRRSQNSFISDT